MKPTILPPKFKHSLDAEWLRTFTWRERLWIALGCPVKITLNMLTEHSTGKFSPDLRVQLAPTQETPRKPKTKKP